MRSRKVQTGPLFWCCTCTFLPKIYTILLKRCFCECTTSAQKKMYMYKFWPHFDQISWFLLYMYNLYATKTVHVQFWMYTFRDQMYTQMYNSHQRKGDRVYGLDAITLEEAFQKQRFSTLRVEIRASGSAVVCFWFHGLRRWILHNFAPNFTRNGLLEP